MLYIHFLERVIEEGIAAAKQDYTRANQEEMLKGAIEGFEACREKKPSELAVLLMQARKERERSRDDSHWRLRCKELEIEWVSNVVSAALMNQKEPVIIAPTARGVMQAAKILGETNDNLVKH